MRIIFDLQGIQGRSGTRGIGQYSFEVVKELCQQLNEHEIYFLINNCLELQQDRVREIQRIQPNATWIPLDYPTINCEFTENLEKVALAIRNEAVTTISPDWVHVCSVVEGFAEPVVGHTFGRYLSTCFFYDAIPAIYPEKFLPTPAISDWYSNRTATYKNYDAIFAISSIAKAEAVDFLDISDDVVTTIWGGLNHRKFENLQAQNQSNITYVGSFEERKNLPRLIEAFAASIPYLEDSVNLILVGKYHGSERDLVDAVIKNQNIENRVIIKGYLSDTEIETVFHETKLLVFPSLHEGLGLPLLEAMARGIPAIASNVSSMEVILRGLDNTFDPLSIHSMSEKIVKYMNNSKARDALVKEFNKRRPKYSWERSASELLSAVKNLPKTQAVAEDFDKAHVRAMLDRTIQEMRSWTLDSDEREQTVRALSRNFKVLLDQAPVSNLKGEANYTLAGHFSGSYSLSQLNRNAFLAAQSLNVGSSYLPEYYNEASENFSIDSSFQPIEFGPTFQEKMVKLQGDLILMRNAYPPIANDMKGQLNLFHTFNWEETEFPQEYVAEFNHFLDGITLATTFVQKTLIDNGVSIPSRVVGASSCVTVDESNFPKRNKSASEKFTFLHISSAFPRKGIDVLLDAFGQAFTRKDQVKLIIKTFPNPHNNIVDLLATFKKEFPNHAEIVLINQDSTTQDILVLYAQADCLVSPSRGEGFGLPMYEALTFGIPVIATNWGGHTDFVSSETGLLIDFEYAPSGSHLGSNNSAWAEPKVESLIECMREMQNNPKRIKFQGESWAANVVKNQEFVNAIAGTKIIKPKTAWVTTFNTRCGIAEYSKGLLENYPDGDVLVFPPNTGTPLDEEIEYKLKRIWTERGDLSRLTEEILSSDMNTVVVQHNWGFFEVKSFNEFILKLSSKKNVILEMHALRDISLNAYPDLERILPSLKAASRIIVHDISDLNLLKTYGLIENTMILSLAFPMPVNEFNFHLKIDQEIVIGTSGFALPNKNQELLIDVANRLSEVYRKVTVKYLCPLHTDPSSLVQIQRLEELGQQNSNIEVVIETNFLSDNEILLKLNECDLLIYAYKDTGETASAAVRHGISSGVPTIVTPAPIFTSNRDLVFIAEGYTSGDIYKKVLTVIDLLKDKNTADQYSTKVFNTVLKNSRLNISLRIQGMSQGLLNIAAR
jgi:glycosyltransferase involved in cell wall biosynthesis